MDEYIFYTYDVYKFLSKKKSEIYDVATKLFAVQSAVVRMLQCLYGWWAGKII